MGNGGGGGLLAPGGALRLSGGLVVVLTSVASVVVVVVVVVVTIMLLVSAVRVVLVARDGIFDGADTILLVSAVRVVFAAEDSIHDGVDTPVDNILPIRDVVTTGNVVDVVVAIEVDTVDIVFDIIVGNTSGICIDGICIGGRVTLVDVMTALMSMLDLLVMSRVSNLFIPDGGGRSSRWLPPVDASSSSRRAIRVTGIFVCIES